ncbi:hypothetical protein [Streptomyces goshikiensis]
MAFLARVEARRWHGRAAERVATAGLIARFAGVWAAFIAVLGGT